jgi:hypothetical protein
MEIEQLKEQYVQAFNYFDSVKICGNMEKGLCIFKKLSILRINPNGYINQFIICEMIASYYLDIGKKDINQALYWYSKTQCEDLIIILKKKIKTYIFFP